MKENRITIIVNRPVNEVFEFSTNPKNTHLWSASIKEEITDEYPPKIGTMYKNRWDAPIRDTYKVSEFEQDKLFTLSDLDENYHVRYTYRALDDNKTEMEYFEWMANGDLSNPYTKDVLEKLKSIIEMQTISI